MAFGLIGLVLGAVCGLLLLAVLVGGVVIVVSSFSKRNK